MRFRGLLLGGVGRRGARLGDAMGNEVHHIEAGHALLVQEVDGVGVLLAEDGHEHIGPGDLLLAVGGGLDMHDGPLNDPLEAQRGLGVDVVGALDDRRVLGDVASQGFAQDIHVDCAGPKDVCRRWVVEQGQEQMLHGDELMTLLAGFHKGHVETDF